MTTHSDTVTRILDTAEALFAERGFAETSLRTITSKAKVNLAAVNYHFGSKKSLIHAVFARYLDPFCAHLSLEIDRLEKKQPSPDLELLLERLAFTLLNTQTPNKQGLSVFMRLLGLAYTQAQGHLRDYLQAQYGEVFRRFVRLLSQATGELPEAERFWRVHFMLGAMIFTMSSLNTLRDLAAQDFQDHTNVRTLVARLMPFICAGMQAPLPEVQAGLATSPFVQHLSE